MLRKLGACLLLTALLASLNLHWVVVQGVAWAGMLQKESQRTETMQQAIERTFGGDYPCEWCGLVEKNFNASNDEPASTQSELLSKIKLLPMTFSQVGLKPQLKGMPLMIQEIRAGLFVVSPETPPPRV